MRNGVLALAVLVVVLCASAAPASGAQRPLVGIGDQKTQMFEDPRFRWLGVKHARLVVPWYVGSGTNPEELAYVDRWLRAARRAGVQPLIGFGHGFIGWTRIYLPKVAEYRRAVKQFRQRYPWVKNYITWNEANHCSQPTCRKPARVAEYYDALRRECKGCTIVGAALIDQPNMTKWLKAFRKKAKGEPKVYGLHNYLDVNRLRTSGTRRLLRAVPKARIWITETGGLVYRKHYKRKADFPENAVHAGKVTSHVLRTARALERIDRVYLYHWNVDRFQPTWDSGLIDHLGGARPGFRVLARHLRRNPSAAPRPAAPPLAQPAPPVGTNPPPPGQAPPPGGGSSPPPSSGPPSGGGGGGTQPPPEEECTLSNLCIDPLNPLS
jgi:hypothetical protein